jgi:large subunit ribosomal protein L30
MTTKAKPNDVAASDAAAAEAQTSTKDGKTVTVTLFKSINGTRESHRATVRGLGLRRMNSVSTLEDTPAVRGMINKVSYLVKVV